jgi:hypothetical protein
LGHILDHEIHRLRSLQNLHVLSPKIVSRVIGLPFAELREPLAGRPAHNHMSTRHLVVLQPCPYVLSGEMITTEVRGVRRGGGKIQLDRRNWNEALGIDEPPGEAAGARKKIDEPVLRHGVML